MTIQIALKSSNTKLSGTVSTVPIRALLIVFGKGPVLLW